MRSVTFVSTSRSDFATIISILEFSCLTEYLKVNLLICKDVGYISRIKNLNIIKLEASTAVDKFNKSQLEIEISSSLSKISRESPRTIVFIVGDRWETLYVAYECLLLNLPLIHHSGGDITNGAIDNQIRDAITALSDYHLTSNKLHSDRIIKLGESEDKIFTVGEPVLLKLKNEIENYKEFKNIYKIKKPYVLCCFHSSTLESISFKDQALKIIKILEEIKCNIIITYPNMDPGGLLIHNELKNFSKKNKKKVFYIKKLGKEYFNYLINCLYLIGNSSSGILEAGLASKISINVGNRQNGRLRSRSTIDIKYSSADFVKIFHEIDYKYSKLSPEDYQSPYFNEQSIKLIEKFLKGICKLNNITKVKKKIF